MEVMFTSRKKVDESDDRKQKSKTGYYPPKRELGQLRSHLFLYFLRGLDQISFPSLFVDGQNPAPNLIDRTLHILYILEVFAIATGASFCLSN